MTSFKQIEANRRNARKSTGPSTEQGKQRSRCNAVRHGLTAETVIGALENAEDFQAFEAAITADYDASSAVERELVLRLASLLWRLRRATAMETGLLELHADHPSEMSRSRRDEPNRPGTVYKLLPSAGSVAFNRDAASRGVDTTTRAVECGFETESAEPASASAIDLAHCFLRLANLPNFPHDRLCRYETMLCRQVSQTLFLLDALDRRKPQERRPSPEAPTPTSSTR